ncbi:hypothetical protein [Trichormus azollae]|uniref:hypothetical protein n=1 Tax=Trichormus azollae TaxID=1164 RepID=UPI00325EEFCC
MTPSTQGIPGLPHLTYPDELVQFGTKVIQGSLLFVFLIVALGVVITLISFSLRRNTTEQRVFFGEWFICYSQLLKEVEYLALILGLLITGFFLTSTFAYFQWWKQAKVGQVAESVAEDKLEQNAPQIRYITEEAYTYTTRVNGRIVKVNDKQKVTRYLNLVGLQIQVKIDQSVNV